MGVVVNQQQMVVLARVHLIMVGIMGIEVFSLLHHKIHLMAVALAQVVFGEVVGPIIILEAVTVVTERGLEIEGDNK